MFYYLTGMGILMLFPVFNSETTRIGLSGSLMFAFCIPLMILPLRGFSSAIKWPLIGIFALLSFFSWKSYEPAKLNPEYADYLALTQKLNSSMVEVKPEMLIAKHPLCYFISYHGNIRSRPWVDDIALYSPGYLQRISLDISLQEIQPYLDSLNSSTVLEIIPGYLLWDELTWKNIKERTRVSGNAILENKMVSNNNPYKTQLDFREFDKLVMP